MVNPYIPPKKSIAIRGRFQNDLTLSEGKVELNSCRSATTSEQIILEKDERIAILSKKLIELVDEQNTRRESGVLGDALVKFLAEFIVLFCDHMHTGVQTGGGISGPPMSNFTNQLRSKGTEESLTNIVLSKLMKLN